MFFALLLALTGAQVGIQAPARDASSLPGQPAATAIVRGRVTERESGQPLPRFRVSVSRQVLVNEGVATVATAITDADGMYELAKIPPGSYLITARPPELVATHLPQMYGYEEPLPLFGALRIRTLELRAGALLQADIAVRRGRAIEGLVATEEGDPLTDAQVTLERIDVRAQGRAILTDDRGFYRHFGLPPGRYRLCVTPSERAQPGARDALLKTCHPTDQDPANPAAVEVRTADVRNVDLVVRRGRRFAVSGSVVDSSGSAFDRGELSFIEQGVVPRRSVRVERPEPGRFVIRDVEPGRYELRASVEADPARAGTREFAALEVTVAKDDLTGLVLQTRRPAAISGVVVFEGGAPADGTETMVVRLQQDMSAPAKLGMVSPGRTVRKDLTFELSGVVEPVTIGLDFLPPGWLVRSVLYRGRDVTDEPVTLETSDDPRAIEITLTNRVAHINGRAATKPPPTQAVIVLVLGAERTRGRGGSGNGTTVARSALLAGDGTFKIGPLMPGEYFVAAADRDQWFDASVRNRASAINSLLTRAERVVLFEGEQPQVVVNVVPMK